MNATPLAMNDAEARQVLDQLGAGALDALPAVARDRLRDEALAVLSAPPVAEVVAVSRSRRGGRTVAVKCPHCEELHVHGWAPGSVEPGLRTPHCLAAASYFIPAPSTQGMSE